IKTAQAVYLVMEYCDGDTLKTVLRPGHGMREYAVQKVFKNLIYGLFELWHRGIIHRDIKPPNILLVDKHSSDVFYPGSECKEKIEVRITDFGLACYKTHATATSYLCGTPFYMAPERLTKQNCTHRSDIWSVGVVLHEMLYGYLPYTASTPWELLQKIKAGKPALDKSSGVSYKWRAVMGMFLERVPERRFCVGCFFYLEKTLQRREAEGCLAENKATNRKRENSTQERKRALLSYFLEALEYLFLVGIVLRRADEQNTQETERVFTQDELGNITKSGLEDLLDEIRKKYSGLLNEETIKQYLRFYAKMLHRYGIVAGILGRRGVDALFFKTSAGILSCLKGL
ncbi:MAG: ULK protein kinase, partial [Amphiamblys sp. WSBS2006]